MKRQRVELRNGAPPSVRGVISVLAVLMMFFSPAAASAVSLDGTSRSYLLSRETAAGTKLLPGFEYLDFSVKDIAGESISAHFGGWGSYDFEEETGDTDLQYAFLSFKQGSANSVVNLGRVMVFEGVAAERVDGAYARTDLQGGFGVSAFGGVPVLTNLDDQPGNELIYGARLSHQTAGLYTIGFSYLKSEFNDRTFREEQGVDLWLRPMDKVELLGRSSYNAETTGWMEHSYNLLLGPFDKLRLNTEVSQFSYEDYFVALTNNAFTFQPGGPIDPKEKLNILGETVSYAFTDQVNASVEYRKFNYDIAGAANRAGVSVTYSIPASYSAGVSLHRMDGETDRLSYNEYRAYAFKKLGKADAALDLLHVKYDEPINTVTNAYSASLALGYELTHSLKVGLDAEYAKNPDFDKDVRVFAKLIYSFSAERGRSAGQAQKSAPPTAVEQRPAASPAAGPAATAIQPVVEPQPAASPAAEPMAAAPQPVVEAQPAAAPAEEPTASPQGNEQQGAQKEGVQ